MNKKLKIITSTLIIFVAVAGASYIAKAGTVPKTIEMKQAALLVNVIRSRITHGPFLIHAQGQVWLPLSERDLAFLDFPAVGDCKNSDWPVTQTGTFAGQAARWHTPKPYFSGVFP